VQRRVARAAHVHGDDGVRPEHFAGNREGFGGHAGTGRVEHADLVGVRRDDGERIPFGIHQLADAHAGDALDAAGPPIHPVEKLGRHAIAQPDAARGAIHNRQVLQAVAVEIAADEKFAAGLNDFGARGRQSGEQRDGGHAAEGFPGHQTTGFSDHVHLADGGTPPIVQFNFG